ncbi:MAG: hypothetical protein NC133_01560 [Prevotella sp.]|nr:hypothetical protein [Prevotella sp.]
MEQPSNLDYLAYISRQDKAEFHNHVATSSPWQFLVDHGIDLPTPRDMVGIQALLNYSRRYIDPIKLQPAGLRILLDGDFQNCLATKIKRVNTSIDYKVCIRTFHGDVAAFIDFLRSFHYDGLTILWDLDISRDSYQPSHHDVLTALISSRFFYGIDLAATENSQPNALFVKFFRLADRFQMVTKVHAGEQLGADYVKQCILDFNPRHIQHGITIVDDPAAMQLAKERGIVFNVCPSSNVALGYAPSIQAHPIKTMVEFGLHVTINTDDLLFFNSDLNHEYHLLYVNKVLSFDQLEQIRQFALSL